MDDVTLTGELEQDFLFGRNIPMLNENGIANILVDVELLESEFKQMGKTQLISVFAELRLVSVAYRFCIDSSIELYAFKTTSLALNNTVSNYLQPAARRSVYASVQPKNLYALLDKMAKFGQGSRVPAEREAADRRRKDADAVARIIQ